METISRVQFTTTSTATDNANIGLLQDRFRMVNFEPGGTVELAAGSATDLTITDTKVVSNSNFETAQKATITKALITNSLFDQGTISVSQNNYGPPNLSSINAIVLTATANINITGIDAQEDGFNLTLINNGTATITLTEFDGGSISVNRFASGTDYDLLAGRAVDLVYRTISGGKWFIKN